MGVGAKLSEVVYLFIYLFTTYLLDTIIFQADMVLSSKATLDFILMEIPFCW